MEFKRKIIKKLTFLLEYKKERLGGSPLHYGWGSSLTPAPQMNPTIGFYLYRPNHYLSIYER